MRKETKANLVFALLLLILIAPGFFILMKKKLSGSTEPAHLPPLIPHEAAYIQPEPIPPRAPRVEPPEVRGWVMTLLHDQIDPNSRMVRDPLNDSPIVGNRYTTQLVYMNHDKLVFLIWSDNVPSVRVWVDGSSELVTDSVTWIEIPKHIRHVLQKVGYIDPPQRIAWVQAKLPGILASGQRIKIVYPPTEEFLKLPDSVMKP
ncbi:MAG: hypothetical protein KatS3mg104_1956 [Phycisphaerae bacterium]|nr:MAG: hypothetical protein KatS3mg104_1956 [Phycisphaerae bacterium]